ncbi:MAG TPA: hypothetical protein VFG14_11450, partial [Chthoniobacteraceae bacterium]|nr:hypothetical protein [Chthoniobacteraceae bacterium]
MNAREKMLATIVGGMLVALITYLLFSTFQKHLTKLKNQLSDRQTELTAMQTLSTEREVWLKRDEFFKGQQPPLVNP